MGAQHEQHTCETQAADPLTSKAHKPLPITHLVVQVHTRGLAPGAQPGLESFRVLASRGRVHALDKLVPGVLGLWQRVDVHLRVQGWGSGEVLSSGLGKVCVGLGFSVIGIRSGMARVQGQR